MIRIALIADIHANLPALEAVLADADADAGLDAIHHLGDLVGYAPWPNEVVDLMAARGITGVGGNYDTTVATDYVHCGCRYEDAEQERLSHESYAWTRAHVNGRTKRWLGALPFRIDLRPLGGHASGPRVVLVHGTPTLNTVYWTEDRPDRFCAQMAAQAGLRPGDAIAFGHTHRPWHRVVDGIHLVNAGSVGRPKDGDWRACYAVLALDDGGAIDVGFRRVAYDVDRAAAGIRESGLPDAFATMLRTGGALREGAAT
jgi:predicted phosphodiesterase